VRALGLLIALLGAAAGCGDAPRAPAGSPAPAVSTPAAPAPGAAPGPVALDPPPRPLHRCFPEDPPWEDAAVDRLIERAADRLDADDAESALACAEEAVRQAPRSVAGHHDRALALLGLHRLDDARDAFTLALALAPDDPQTLEGVADLYVNQLPPSADHSAVGLAYAQRATRLLAHGSHRRNARRQRASLALLEGQALVDLGQPGDALPRLATALALDPANGDAKYERGVALFELCRFAEARRALTQVVAHEPDHGDALYHLALLDEREGHDADAARRFAAATAARPEAFPTPPDVPPADFAARVEAAVGALPADMRADLAGVPVETAELPLLADLTGERPPLSPTILGLFRGFPLGDDGGGEPSAGRAGATGRPAAERGGTDAALPGPAAPARTIVLYRRNLLRTVKTTTDLDQAITRTLFHEVGHLRGEDDGSLHDRGLE
jgi:tetratricopeptide (TPR) repeat protein